MIDELAQGTAQVQARFADAILGEMAAMGTVDVLEVVSIVVDPTSLAFPQSSTEIFEDTATLDGASQTEKINFDWSSSDDSIATATSGTLSSGTAHVANVTGQSPGAATITASTASGSLVSGPAHVTLAPRLRNELLQGRRFLPSTRSSRGDLRILDGQTGELFRFVDLNSDGDTHFFIDDSTIPGTKFAADDPIRESGCRLATLGVRAVQGRACRGSPAGKSIAVARKRSPAASRPGSDSSRLQTQRGADASEPVRAAVFETRPP